MPFKTIPKIVSGRAGIKELRGKEIMALLMMDLEPASKLSKYKFKIEPSIFRALEFKNLTEMSRATGWRWKKKQAFKTDDKDKLLFRYYNFLSKSTCIREQIYIDTYHRKFKDKFEHDDAFVKVVIDSVSKDSKEKKRLYKKYKIKEVKQQSLW